MEAETDYKKTGRKAPSRCKDWISKALADFDGLDGLLFLFDGHLRDDDVQDAVFDLRADLLLVDVVG